MTQAIAFDKFKGIREQNGIVDISSGVISALEAKNVEFYATNISNCVGIRTIQGRTLTNTLDESYTIYGDFTSRQNNHDIRLLYVEDDTKGMLLRLDTTPVTLIDNLPKTGKCNGITMLYGEYDTFVLTNGEELWFYAEGREPEVEEINPVDAEGRDIKGLCLFTQDQRLGIETKNRVHWSKQMDITNWSAQDLDSDGNPLATNAAYEEFTNNITAIAQYINGIVAFTESDSTYLSGNPAIASQFVREDASIGGTPCFSSVVVHDKYLFYYDHKQNNIYYFIQNDVGQKRTGDPIAFEIQQELVNVDFERINKVFMKSVYADGKNEIWVIFPQKENGQSIFVFDYLFQEWVERTLTDVNTVNTANNAIYTSSGNKIYRENLGTFEGQSLYKMSIINMGSDTNLKIPKLVPTVSVDNLATNDFWVQIRVDGKDKVKEKYIKSRFKDYFTWGDDTSDESNQKQLWDLNNWAIESQIPVVQKLPPIPAFKWLELTFLTKNIGEEFSIKRFEVKKIRTKYKTL